MKIFTQGIFARRKIVLLFFLAILLPSLVVGYLSFRTFSERRTIVRSLLESNLWISGETALRSLEDTLLEYEKEALKPENFRRLTQPETNDRSQMTSSSVSDKILGQPFLLDSEFEVIVPRSRGADISSFRSERDESGDPFYDAFREAERIEFSQRDYAQAAELYKKVASDASSEDKIALALGALGRCLLSLEKYDEAYQAYQELSLKYGQLTNEVGHPYGIAAGFQLYEIESRLNGDESGLKYLLDLYEKIRSGTWSMSLSLYDFSIVEIETILDERTAKGKFPEIQKSYTALKAQKSAFLEDLIFVDFLKREAIPKMRERSAYSQAANASFPLRFLVSQGEDGCLISYTHLPEFRSKRMYYGGFCWDLDSLKKELPKLLTDLEESSRSHFQILDEKGQNVVMDKNELVSGDAVDLSFRRFPLPWKLLVSQPGFGELARTTRRENFFYGVLLVFIVVLMLLGAILIARDISRESETTHLKTEFVHNISHELKTPLTLIRLYGETLQYKRRLSEEEKDEAYEIITKESERLSHLINNVLDFSRIEMGRKEFDFKKGDLAQVVRDTLESYRYHLEKKGFTIHKEIAADIPEVIFDDEAVTSVLINLLSNALKFSPEEKEVLVRLFRDDGQVVLQVQDKGIGISQKELSRIFDRFYRSRGEAVAEAKGSGLGLTLVKHITEAHGGRVDVESRPGEGTTFSVILPIHREKG
jgi:signal transduction histidine kinase